MLFASLICLVSCQLFQGVDVKIWTVDNENETEVFGGGNITDYRLCRYLDRSFEFKINVGLSTMINKLQENEKWRKDVPGFSEGSWGSGCEKCVVVVVSVLLIFGVAGAHNCIPHHSEDGIWIFSFVTEASINKWDFGSLSEQYVWRSQFQIISS